jgi:hypothetical protein
LTSRSLRLNDLSVDQFEADDREFRRPDAEMRMHVEPKVLRLLVYSSIYMNCAYSALLAVWRRSHGHISTHKRSSRHLDVHAKPYCGIRSNQATRKSVNPQSSKPHANPAHSTVPSVIRQHL